MEICSLVDGSVQMQFHLKFLKIMELLALVRANLINCTHTQRWKVSGEGAGETTFFKSIKPGFSISPWRRKWQPAPVFLPGKPHGQRSLAGYSPQGNKVRHKLATEQFQPALSLSISRLKNPRFSFLITLFQ